jgi:spoIIIJ-associated protein
MTRAESADDRVRELVVRVVEAFGLDASVEVELAGEEIHVTVDGDEVGPFIGREGAVIDAVQHLAYKVAGSSEGPGPRVVVDAGGYRERRREALTRAADQAADRAIESGREVALEPMSAIERKVVHEYLRDRGDVETWSEGTEPERHLVVAPLSP